MSLEKSGVREMENPPYIRKTYYYMYYLMLNTIIGGEREENCGRLLRTSGKSIEITLNCLTFV